MKFINAVFLFFYPYLYLQLTRLMRPFGAQLFQIPVRLGQFGGSSKNG